jgi:gluconate 2-dehydrogenase gamma chain
METEGSVGLLERPISRRRFLAMSGATVGLLALGGTGLAACTNDNETTTTVAGGGSTTTVAAGQTSTTTAHGGSSGLVQPLMTISAVQANLLAGVVSRLIPKDDLGPSAAEAGVVGYIDRALQEQPDRGATFIANLDALDSYATVSQGKDFLSLESAQQDAVIAAIQTDKATGFTAGSALFFLSLRQATLEGMFGDPYYGGNQGFVGWELIGFPGIRLDVPEADQALDAKPALIRESVYDHGEFGYKVQGG